MLVGEFYKITALTEDAQYVLPFANLLHDGVLAHCHCLFLGLIYFDGLIMHSVDNANNIVDIFGRPDIEHFPAEPWTANSHQVGYELPQDRKFECYWPRMQEIRISEFG